MSDRYRLQRAQTLERIAVRAEERALAAVVAADRCVALGAELEAERAVHLAQLGAWTIGSAAELIGRRELARLRLAALSQATTERQAAELKAVEVRAEALQRRVERQMFERLAGRQEQAWASALATAEELVLVDALTHRVATPTTDHLGES